MPTLIRAIVNAYMCVGHGISSHLWSACSFAYDRLRCSWFVLKEAILGICDLKMFKLGPSCVYKHKNGVGVIRTSYFARNSEVLLITVMSRSTEVYKIVDYVCCIQPVEASGTNPSISRKRTILVKYSIGR